MLFMLLVSAGIAFVTTSAANIATTVYLHRSITHQAFVLKRPAEMFFRIVCWLTTNVYPREWAAIHRKHHAFTDVEGDPHSPLLEGFWKIQLFNPYYYAAEAKKIDMTHWARGVPEYPWLDKHCLTGILVSLIAATGAMCLVAVTAGVSPWWGLLFGLVTVVLHGLFYNLLSAAINGLCHYWGYKNFKEAEAYNVRSVAMITFGEGLHNNHHKYQRSPKLSTGHRRLEFDIGWLVIRLLDAIGQIKSKSELWPASAPAKART